MQVSILRKRTAMTKRPTPIKEGTMIKRARVTKRVTVIKRATATTLKLPPTIRSLGISNSSFSVREPLSI
jgi:hypothetical protein